MTLTLPAAMNLSKPLRYLATALALMLWLPAAWSAATTHAVAGDVLLTPAKGAEGKLAVGQRVETGATIKTAHGANAVLRFDDGQIVSVGSDSLFVITEYKFDPHKPKEGSFVGSLFKGAVRAVTGVIGETNKDNVKVKTPAATIGIRGTDFGLFLDSRLYLHVYDGAISATNAGGQMVFSATNQPYGIVASPQTAPRAAQPEELPAAVQGTFRQFQGQPLSDKIRKPDPKDPTCADRR